MKSVSDVLEVIDDSDLYLLCYPYYQRLQILVQFHRHVHCEEIILFIGLRRIQVISQDHDGVGLTERSISDLLNIEIQCM